MPRPLSVTAEPRPAGPLTILCDFDGTITTVDIGDSLCRRFAPGVLERVDALWHAGRLSFGEAFRLACLELKAPESELVAHALEVGELRAGFLELVEVCRQSGAELVVASAGLDLYIEPILRRALGPGLGGLELHCAAASVTPQGVRVEFPHQHPDCAECGTCKGLRARRARALGRRVLGIGDSFSDRCLVREADHVFARSWLAGHCAAESIPHSPFDDFAPVVSHVLESTRG